MERDQCTFQRQMTLLALIVAVLSSLVTLLSSHYTYQSLAQPIIRTILSPEWIHRLHSYLGGANAELILVSLKMFNSLTNFANGRERKALFEAFAWEAKTLQKLFQMRRQSKNFDNIDILTRPDIRTLYILFLLSFVDTMTPTVVKSAFLEQRRDIFGSIFKGLWRDHHSLVKRVLEVCWTGIWSDQKLKRTYKLNVFNEATLSQLIRIYERDSKEGDDAEHVPADVVHHFLLAICTHPGLGICFRDRGWYPRQSDPEPRLVYDEGEATDTGADQRGIKIYNKILANVLRSLKVNDDPRQQELALKIFAACPELVSNYWSASPLALEPRLSSKWIANMSFLGSVISLPVPQSTFFLQDNDQRLYQPVPPPLSTVVDNILPSMNIKTHLSRGLQSSSTLVQHCSALALTKCLLKYETVMHSLDLVSKALEEDEEGHWCRRRREVEREVRRRVPDFQVVIGFSQKLSETVNVTAPISIEAGIGPTSNSIRSALLFESAQRVLWLYHRCLPFIVAEVRFDTGKLLQGFSNIPASADSAASSVDGGLATLRQLHVLRLLKESDQFVWSGKTGSQSNLHILLTFYVQFGVSAVQRAVASLLSTTLAGSIIFQHDIDEVILWLDSLPFTRRSPGAESPDGAPLTDESDSVISFLDECVQRCIKTPYRYLEDLQTLISQGLFNDENNDNELDHVVERPDRLPSPLLMAVLEQFGAKLQNKLLISSDVLAILSFIRKLVLNLAGKLPTLKLLTDYTKKVAAIVRPYRTFSKYPIMTAAIQREMDHLECALWRLQRPEICVASEPSSVVQDFLLRVEGSSTLSSAMSQQMSTYELVDWLRLVDPLLSSSDIGRLVVVIERLHKIALKEFFQFLRPNQSLWDNWETITQAVRLHARFEMLFIHCNFDTLVKIENRQLLVSSLFLDSVQIVDLKRAMNIIHHRLSYSRNQGTVVKDLLVVLAMIIDRARSKITRAQINILINELFQYRVIKSYCCQPLQEVIRLGLKELLEVCFNAAMEDDKQLIREYTSFWSLYIRDHQQAMPTDQEATALLWIKYFGTDESLSLLDFLTASSKAVGNQSNNAIIEELLGVLASTTSPKIARSRLSTLLTLRSSFPHLTSLESMLAAATYDYLPLCLGGLSMPSGTNMSRLVCQSQERWSQRLDRIDEEVDITIFLMAEHWTHCTVDIISGLLYQQASAAPAVLCWLRNEPSAPCSAYQLARILFSLFDSAFTHHTSFDGESDYFLPHFDRLVRTVAAGKTSRESRYVSGLCVDCICCMVERLPTLRSSLWDLLRRACTSMSPDMISADMLSIGRRLSTSIGLEANSIVDHFVDTGLIWAVRHFAANNDETDEATEALAELSTLLRSVPSVKSHLAEPVIAVVVQYRLSDKDALHLTQILVQKARLKPAVVNKHLQGIVQHPSLYDLCTTSSTNGTSTRDSIIGILHVLFHLHPINTCQPTHVEPLCRVYGGSLSLPDRKLLSIFQLFEVTRKTSTATLLSHWSSIPHVTCSNGLEALGSLDPIRVFRTCLAFPDWRRLQDHDIEDHDNDNQLYDPPFLVLIFAQMLSDGPPSSALSWVQLFRTNIVSLLIRCLSARDSCLREAALAQISALYRILQDADMHEKPYVDYILNLLKNLLFGIEGSDSPRLSAFATLLLAHALRGIFYPSNFIYPLTARFLLQRPEIDDHDVPMLFGMLYSSSDEWKKERGWIVRFLSDGMVSSEEWKVMKRRHTWDLLASLFQSEGDHILKRGILELLANLTCNVRATTSLVMKSSLLSWIEIQLCYARGDELIAWIKILENIIVVVNPMRIETPTHGEWRSIMGRCILSILHSPSCTKSVFHCVVPVVLRLSLLSGPSIPRMEFLMKRCILWLRSSEADLRVPLSSQTLRTLRDQCNTKFMPPHHAPRLFDIPEPNSIDIWGSCVEALWRVSMTQERKFAEWDELTCRLLIWRSIAGKDGSAAGEWARREVVKNLASLK
ncbi:hypothetical protein AcW1_004074 [Taiwanofungus camphoratus]|nr:hypothetical protein AcV5_000454 [Antrodia cinnamomea]KAI0959166.1 hypothetical protein AcW1_004074 [Antrodia cinnamomea]